MDKKITESFEISKEEFVNLLKKEYPIFEKVENIDNFNLYYSSVFEILIIDIKPKKV